jgi:cytochrome P450
MRTALELVLDRFPDIALDEAVEAPYVTGTFFRMPTSVPVTLH